MYFIVSQYTYYILYVLAFIIINLVALIGKSLQIIALFLLEWHYKVFSWTKVRFPKVLKCKRAILALEAQQIMILYLSSISVNGDYKI